MRLERVARGWLVGLVLAFPLALGCRSAPGSVAPEPEPSGQARPGVASSAAPAPTSDRRAGPRASAPTTLGRLVAHYVGPAPESAAHVAILLHGFGDRGDGLVDLARDLNARRPELGVVALEGRLAHPEGGRMWWSIDIERVRRARLGGEWPSLERERPVDASEARDAVVEALSQLSARGVPRERVVLAGFSQGAMLAVDVGLARPDLVRAVVAWSGAIFDRGGWEQRAPLTPRVHFVVAHGERDTVLPFAQGEALHSLLRSVDPSAAWVPFDGAHTVSAEGRDALLGLLAAP